MLFDLDFSNNAILFCFFFLIIDLHLLIPAYITYIFNPAAELTIPKGITTKEAKTEVVTHPLNLETKISDCSI